MRLLGGNNSVSFVVWLAASFSNNEHKISSKAQNERWIGKDKIYMKCSYFSKA